jgi:hypothetical protein
MFLFVEQELTSLNIDSAIDGFKNIITVERRLFL